MNNLPFEYELDLRQKYKFIAGLDEAGRGCLAGPVCGAAVILPDSFVNTIGIDDSKKLNAGKREKVYFGIVDKAVSFSFVFVDNLEIDKINILQASIKAMNDAASNLIPLPNYLLVDGNQFNSTQFEFSTIIKGDTRITSIAAASIIAKFERDKFMITQVHNEYPEYGFNKHKGYATKEHFQNIDKFGLCKYHRVSFLKKYFSRQLKMFE